MEHSLKYKEGKVLIKKQLFTYFYLAVYLLFYMGYILLDSYRLNKSDYWITKINLNQQDVQNISQLAVWQSIFEVMFLALFIIVASIIVFPNRKNKQVLKRFLLVHISFFMTILLLSYPLTFVTPSPIGNLTQPLITPIFLSGIILIYLGLLMIKEKLYKKG